MMERMSYCWIWIKTETTWAEMEFLSQQVLWVFLNHRCSHLISSLLITLWVFTPFFILFKIRLWAFTHTINLTIFLASKAHCWHLWGLCHPPTLASARSRCWSKCSDRGCIGSLRWRCFCSFQQESCLNVVQHPSRWGYQQQHQQYAGKVTFEHY